MIPLGFSLTSPDYIIQLCSENLGSVLKKKDIIGSPLHTLFQNQIDDDSNKRLNQEIEFFISQLQHHETMDIFKRPHRLSPFPIILRPFSEKDNQCIPVMAMLHSATQSTMMLDLIYIEDQGSFLLSMPRQRLGMTSTVWIG